MRMVSYETPSISGAPKMGINNEDSLYGMLFTTYQLTQQTYQMQVTSTSYIFFPKYYDRHNSRNFNSDIWILII